MEFGVGKQCNTQERWTRNFRVEMRSKFEQSENIGSRKTLTNKLLVTMLFAYRSRNVLRVNTLEFPIFPRIIGKLISFVCRSVCLFLKFDAIFRPKS